MVMKNEIIALLLIVAVMTAAAFVFLSRKEKGEEETPSPSELPENYFSIDNVYFDNFVDIMGNISPYDFDVVVVITSGGRGVLAWSVGIDYKDGIGFQDNVIERSVGGFPSPDNHKLVLRGDMPKWVLPSGQHPKIGQKYYVKIHLILSDNTYLVWEGDAGYP